MTKTLVGTPDPPEEPEPQITLTNITVTNSGTALNVSNISNAPAFVNCTWTWGAPMDPP